MRRMGADHAGLGEKGAAQEEGSAQKGQGLFHRTICSTLVS